MSNKNDELNYHIPTYRDVNHLNKDAEYSGIKTMNSN